MPYISTTSQTKDNHDARKLLKLETTQSSEFANSGVKYCALTDSVDLLLFCIIIHLFTFYTALQIVNSKIVSLSQPSCAIFTCTFYRPGFLCTLYRVKCYYMKPKQHPF